MTLFLVARNLSLDLGRPALIRFARDAPAPAQALGHLLLDGLGALERQPVVHRRRGEQRQVYRLRLVGLFDPLLFHRVGPAVDKRRVVDRAHPGRVRAVGTAPVFPADLFFCFLIRFDSIDVGSVRHEKI